MCVFATTEDYIVRYGAVDDEARLECLLKDASSYLRALYLKQWNEEYSAGTHVSFDENACAVACAIVSRSLNVPAGMQGISQASQGADVYSASYTFANPTGDLYITKSDKNRLGIGGVKIGTIEPTVHTEEDAWNFSRQNLSQ